ncbi:ribonuclease P protein component [Ramlibacter tataouinensis]|uniref:Ribonuclease P protein component (RNaseP protein)-like protein n=1 Tax=Ramlibacter tataouinensis (strain ATCC BAA-407 / DSM 14655 / LMG 21543 / TTB310) TaxID=365046 RepID=F5Y359_RAMTT|nr:ribonuclease P protein component [Ramlibacter tataouinensis]AEG94939.1 ribonuclease P protein component (RNaseP protein)-like protein [Ramlibacter tataouinensis TTB310]
MQRLKTRAQFQAVMAGATVSRSPHFALHRVALDAPPITGSGSPERSQTLFAVRDQAWIGALIPKRWAKRAVTRNAIKRQIYTVAQDFQSELPAAAHVVRLRAAFDRDLYPSATSDALKRAVRAELQRLLAGARA